MRVLVRVTLLFQKTEEEWDFITKMEFDSYKNEKKKLIVEGTKHDTHNIKREVYDLEHPENRLVSIKFWRNSFIDS
jgi:hypothetical protein